MVRMSKKSEIRGVSHHRPRKPSVKTGPLKDNFKKGFKEHPNAAEGVVGVFIPKIK
jgi:hypothetical protein